MLIFLGMLAAGLLLLVLIVLLHRLQYRKKVEAVDRTLPLPPLDILDKERVLAIVDATELDAVGESQAAPVKETWLERLLAKAPNSDKDWQRQARQYAINLDFDSALGCCAVAFPQSGAFRRAAQILRSRIREAQKQAQPCHGLLADLYQIAAWADLLHARLPSFTPLSPRQRRHLDLRPHAHLRFEYEELGCDMLGLLTVTDRRLLAQVRGKPKRHAHVRELHDADLQRMLDREQIQTGAQ